MSAMLSSLQYRHHPIRWATSVDKRLLPMSTGASRKVTMLTVTIVTSNEQGSLTLRIRWDAVITIQDTQNSGSIVMDADDFLDLVVDSRCGMRSLIDGHLNDQFWRCNLGGVDTSFNLTFCLHKHGNTMLLYGDSLNGVRIDQESWRKLSELEVSIAPPCI